MNSSSARTGYARVSTADQILDAQMAALQAARCTMVRTETGAGATLTVARHPGYAVLEMGMRFVASDVDSNQSHGPDPDAIPEASDHLRNHGVHSLCISWKACSASHDESRMAPTDPLTRRRVPDSAEKVAGLAIGPRIPDYQPLMLPTLNAFADGKDTSVSEVRARIADAEGLTPEDVSDSAQAAARRCLRTE